MKGRILAFIAILICLAGCMPPIDRERWIALSTVLEYDPSTDSWTEKASMPTPRGGSVAAPFDGKIYVIGGQTSTIDGDLYSVCTVEAFDPASNSWERKAETPILDCLYPFFYPLAVAGKLYIIRNPSTTIYEYGPMLDRWSGKTSPPVQGLCVALGTDIYVFQQTTFQKYDTTSDVWTPCANIPVKYYGIAVTPGKIFAIAGYDAEGESPLQTWEYDPGADSWAQKSDLPTAQVLYDLCPVIGDRIYVIGPEWNIPFATWMVHEYDSTTDAWTRKSDAPELRCSFKTFVINNKIYLFASSGQVYEFNPLPDTWTERAGTFLQTFPPVELAGKVYLIGGILGK